MKQPPTTWYLKDLIQSATTCSQEIIPGVWVPLRPLGGIGWKARFSAAWKVFTGRADAVVWPNGQ